VPLHEVAGKHAALPAVRDFFVEDAIPYGTAFRPQPPGSIFIRFDASVTIYITGGNGVSINVCEHVTQPFPVGVVMDVLSIRAAIAAEKPAASTDNGFPGRSVLLSFPSRPTTGYIQFPFNGIIP